jgi:glycosyltransferase involved in cell wall biosynthesis
MPDPSPTDLPQVSVLIPVYNEARHIEASLQSIVEQDYPLDRIEVLLAHGESTDDTAEAIEVFRAANPELAVKLLDNPSNNTAVGRNLCLEEATGAFVLNFSAHAVADRSLLRVLVGKLQQLPESAAGIGCAYRRPESLSFIERAITVAMYSPMGGMGRVDSSFHAEQDQIARSVAFTLYKREVLSHYGGFDDHFWCGQDAELNLRLARHGNDIWFTPDTSVEHRKRSNMRSFVGQMYRYGVARAKLTKKYPASLRLLFLLPVIFALGLPAAITMACINLLALGVVGCGAVLFVAASFYSAAKAGGDLHALLCSPLLYCLIYVTYGLGFLRGLLPAIGRDCS